MEEGSSSLEGRSPTRCTAEGSTRRQRGRVNAFLERGSFRRSGAGNPALTAWCASRPDLPTARPLRAQTTCNKTLH